jgi:protein disulfide-isomerase
MKKFLILVVLLVASFTAHAQELKWHTDVSDAAKIALDEKKPLMLFFTGSDWCGWCIRLQKEVFHKPEFAKWAAENVVLVELDFPRKTPQTDDLRKQNFSMQQMFGVTGYPTIWFVSPQQKEGKKVNLDALGNLGYERGGPEAWLAKANQMLNK